MKNFFTNPLIIKEMRERFRTKKTVWILSVYLFVMGAILLGFLYIEQMNRMIVPGDSGEILLLFACIQYGLICFIAPALTAGAISGERERQTLNILLTTQIGPAKIITSKIVTSLVFIFLLVISSLPLYGFVFLYGGISPSQLITLNFFFSVNIFFFGTLGLFCSTWIKKTQVSTITAYGLSFFVVGGTGLILMFVISLLRELDLVAYRMIDITELLPIKILAGLNPLITMAEIMDEKLGPKITMSVPLWVFHTTVYLILSFLFILWSGYLLRPVRRSLLFWRRL